MAVFGTTKIGWKETGKAVTVPNNNKARLMYYLNCVCSVLDLDDYADINRLTKFNEYNLTGQQTDRLIVLCYLLSPDELEGKVLFQNDDMCGERGNKFCELCVARTELAVAGSIVIGGQRKQVTKIMVYKVSWIQETWINPIQEVLAERRVEKALEERARQRQSSTCTIL